MCYSECVMRIRLLSVFLILMSGLPTLGAQQSVPQAVLSAIDGAVFEVVARKPAEGQVTYARELPLDLLPFAIRNDDYISLGTAFAVEPDRFLSAAHVLRLEEPTLRDQLYLRDLSGKTYPISTVFRYDNHRDFALFSAEGLETTETLQLETDHSLNTTVYAVGNALGEGIVIRDGLYTSSTPEPQDGAWQWLRYSAAASPGNSGGPLMNSEGSVIGLVTARSESENLNFALPVEEMIPLVTEPAYLRIDITYGLPSFNARNRQTHETQIPLPATVSELRRSAVSFRNRSLSSQFVALLTENASDIFPADVDGQRRVLWSNPGSRFPLMVSERDDSSWQFLQPEEIFTAETDAGAIRYGTLSGDTFFHLETHGSSGRAFDEPGQLLDRVLAGYPLTRTIAAEEVRIKSLGEPLESQWISDQWGRAWLTARWSIPFADYGLVLYATPTPDGAAGLFAAVATKSVLPYTLDFSHMVNAMYLSYSGTFEQWETFLADSVRVPAPLADARLRYEPNTSVEFDSPRISVSYPSSLLPVSDDSSLIMLLSFKPGAERAQLGISGLYFYGQQGTADRVGIVQHFPAASASDTETRQTWSNILAGRHPYNRSSILSGNETHVLSPLRTQDLTGDPNSVWTIGLSLPGDISARTMEDRFALLEDAVALRSAEVTELTGPVSFIRPVAVADRPVASLAGASDELVSAMTDARESTPVNKGAVVLANTDLLVALERGDAELARTIMEVRPPVYERTNARGESALMLAARYAPSLVSELLGLGATVGLRSGTGDTPLHYAVLGEHPIAVRSLLAAGADPDAANDSGVSPRELAENAGASIIDLFETPR